MINSDLVSLFQTIPFLRRNYKHKKESQNYASHFQVLNIFCEFRHNSQLCYSKFKKSAQILVQSHSVTSVLLPGLFTSEEKLTFQEVIVSTTVVT